MPTSPGLQLPNRLWRQILRVVLATSCRLHIVNQAATKRSGPWILASNHISHFDPPLWSLLAHRPLDWMAMEELFRSRIFAFLLRSVGAFPVRRGTADRAALRTAGQRLSQGRVLGIFPEGGIRDGTSSITAGAPLRPGVTLLAHHHNVPILPCVILGSERLYLSRNWRPLRRVPIWAVCGDFIDPSNFKTRSDLDEGLAAIYPKLTAALVQHYELLPADLPKSPQDRMTEPPLPWPRSLL
jgi:1-acyl-sn-glycerol-3-phosphate acyltransferase